jgi:hypothetical protein
MRGGGSHVATKTPSKGKKAAGPDKGKASAPKKSRASKAPPVEAKEPDVREAPGDEDEDDDEDELEARPTPVKKAPAAGRPASRGAAGGDEAPQVVPARRLTPEAKAKINELVAKGMPLQDALRAAAAWETFVAPVREEPAKLVQGRSFEGGGRPAVRSKDSESEETDEEPAAGDDD